MPASQDIAQIAAGQTAALATVISLLIDKDVITKQEMLSYLGASLAEHNVTKTPQPYASALRHLIHFLDEG